MGSDTSSIPQGGRGGRLVVRILRGAAIGFALYALVVAVVQRSLLFPGARLDAPDGLHEAAPDLERLWLEGEDGRTEAWFLPAPAEAPRPAPAILVAHGNYELIDFGVPFADDLRDLGMHVLLVEYPGYGRSEGSPSEDSITAAFAAARDLLLARPDVDGERLVYFGRSLGGGAVCALARQAPPAALVLQSTFTSVATIASELFVPGFLVRDPFDSLSWIAGWDGPALVFHGRRDEVVPFAHGERLAEAGPGARLEAFDCAHNDFPDDPERYWRVLGDFLREAGVLSGSP